MRRMPNRRNAPIKPSTPGAALVLAPDIATVPDAGAADALWDVVGTYLDAAGGPLYSKVRLLPDHWRAAYVLQYLNRQVENGGFHQFFTNSQGRFDSHLHLDVGFLGHPGYEAAIKDALQCYAGADYADQWENVGKSWEKFTAGYREGLFDDAERRFYALTPGLREVIGRRIKERASEFVDVANGNPLNLKPPPGPGRGDHPVQLRLAWNPFVVAVPLAFLWLVAFRRDFALLHTAAAGFVSIWFLMALADFVSGHKLLGWMYGDEPDD